MGGQTKIMSYHNTSWCLGYLKGVEVMSLSKQELISEVQDDLDSLNPDIPYSYQPLRDLKEKWEGKLK